MDTLCLSCFTDIKERINETNCIANLANDILSNGEIGTVLLSLEDAQVRRGTANAMTKSALVLLCGYFEGFLRNIVVEFVSVLNDCKLPITELSESILYCLFEDSVQGSRESVQENVARIKDCLVGVNHFPFDSRVIGGTKGNPTVDMVESIFQKIGIADVIDRLSIQDFSIDSTYINSSQLDKSFLRKIDLAVGGDRSISEGVVGVIEAKWGPKKKRRSVGYVGVIQELLKVRNRIAHGENFGEQVTPEDLLGHSNNVLRLCEGLHSIVAEELEVYLSLAFEAQPHQNKVASALMEATD